MQRLATAILFLGLLAFLSACGGPANVPTLIPPTDGPSAQASPQQLTAQELQLPAATDAMGSLGNPVPLGMWKTIKQEPSGTVQVALSKAMVADEASKAILKASSFNKAAPDGEQYVAVYVLVQYTNGSKDMPLRFANDTLSVYSSGKVFDEPRDFSIFAPAPTLNAKLLPGMNTGGWIARSVHAGDSNPLLVYNPSVVGAVHPGAIASGIYFSMRPAATQ